METMIIREANPSNRSDVKKFIDLPFNLYGGSEFWVPPMLSDMKAVFRKDVHPFYRHSEAVFFIAEEQGEIMGRIAVMNNRMYNRSHKTNAALFYFFDVYPDDDEEEATQKLFKAAATWARERGLSQILGPLGFHALDGRGVLVEGFDVLPATGIPYNYEYYAPLIEENGFRKKSDFLSGTMKYQDFPEWFYKIKERSKERFWIKSFSDKKEILQWTEKLRLIYNQTFTELFDHYEMSKEEMDFAVKRLIDIADARLIKVMMKDDVPAGFILLYPNIVKGIKKAQGKLWPLGWLHLLRELKATKRVDFNGVATLPKYRGLGGDTVLYSALRESFEAGGFLEGEIIQIEEDNKKSLGEANLLKVNWCKRHRVYIKDL